jgi:hypothetical protein
MTNRSKQKGTTAESAIVAFLRDNGFPHAERRALHGAADRGDIAGIPGIAIESKSCAKFEPAAWLDEATTERANDLADYGVVWFKRRGKSSPGSWFVLMDGNQLVRMLHDLGYGDGAPERVA